MPKQRQQTSLKTVPIDGLDEFPLEVLGLTPESIERSNGHIKIPAELLPYLKICKMPRTQRVQKTKYQQKYLLRLKARESKKALKRLGKRKHTQETES